MKILFADIVRKWGVVRSQKVEVVLVNFSTRMNIATLEKIDNFEAQSSIILPHEYKEFCMIFGSGKFGITHFYIECLPNSIIHAKIEDVLVANEDLIDSYKRGCNWSSAELNILNSGFIFGYGYDKSSCFIFDLKTYSEQDLSYEIYGVYRDDLFAPTGAMYSLGRSFLNFIENICAGDEAESRCPQMLPIPEYPDEDEPEYLKRRTFSVCEEIDEFFGDEEWE